MNEDIKKVTELRARTGAGLMAAKKAYEEAGKDIEKAIDVLRKAGAAKAAKKADRETHEGTVEAYIHAGGKVGSLIVLNCETDFVARNERFQTLAKDIAMHVAASDPEWLTVEDVPQDALGKEKEIQMEILRKEGKPEEMLEKIVEGKLGKFYEEKVLLKQPFIKDDSKTIEELIQDAIAVLGENISLAQYTRFSL
jgi:elongation factor Ts